jgi:hypothetical protein
MLVLFMAKMNNICSFYRIINNLIIQINTLTFMEVWYHYKILNKIKNNKNKIMKS